MSGTPPIKTIKKSYKTISHKSNIDILREKYIVFCRNYLIALFKCKTTVEKEISIIQNVRQYIIQFIKHCNDNVTITFDNYVKINKTLNDLKKSSTKAGRKKLIK
jgi:hypothetical protein